MFQTVEYKFEDSIASIRMNRPETLNALSRRLTEDLTAAVERSIADGARAVLLTGSGRAFCSGGDLREMREIGEQGGKIEAFLDAPLKALHRLIRLIRETPIPFIAAVNGVSAGAGTNLALACDLVVAAADATFNEGFVKIGLSPDCGGTFFLPRAIGEKRAAEMMMTGVTISAQQALEYGMINRVYEAENLISDARALAGQLAAGATGAIGRIKLMLNESYAANLSRQLDLEAECQFASGQSADFPEGVTAFFAKRKPNFTGR